MGEALGHAIGRLASWIRREFHEAGIVQVVAALAAVIGALAAVAAIVIALEAGGDKLATLGLKLSRHDLSSPKFHPGDEVRYTARIRNVSDQAIHEVGVTARTPGGIDFLPSSCVIISPGSSTRGCEPDRKLLQAGISKLNAGDAILIHVTGLLRPSLGRGIQVTMFEATSEETDTKQGVVAVTPNISDGLVAYQDFYRREMQAQVQWQAGSMRKADSRNLLVSQWHRLTPYGQHSFFAVRPWQRIPMERLFDSEALAGKILGFSGSVTDAPKEGKLRNSAKKEHVALQRIPIGKSGEQIWCSTTLPANRLIKQGDRLEVVGVIVAWGSASPDGHPEQAVMLICPAIKRVGGIGTAIQRVATENGGTEAHLP